MGKSILRDKSYLFAIRIVKLSQFLQTDKKEFVLSKQVLRSGTAIGALVKEAEYAQSNADFIHKLKIAAKETCETEYWLLLCKNSDGYESCDELIVKCQSIMKVLSKIIASSKTSTSTNQ